MKKRQPVVEARYNEVMAVLSDHLQNGTALTTPDAAALIAFKVYGIEEFYSCGDGEWAVNGPPVKRLRECSSCGCDQAGVIRLLPRQ